jgi:hypothetical protein
LFPTTTHVGRLGIFFTNLLDLRFLPYITNTNWFLPKKKIKVRNVFFNSREVVEVGRSETFFIATYIGRF